MAFYSLKKWFLKFRTKSYIDWIEEYKIKLYDDWFESLSDEDKRNELQVQKRKEQENRNRLNRIITMLNLVEPISKGKWRL